MPRFGRLIRIGDRRKIKEIARYIACSIGGCRRPEYLRQGAVSCWGAGSPANQPWGIVLTGDALFLCSALERRAFGILQCEPQLLGERVHGRPGALPRPFGLEPQV